MVGSAGKVSWHQCPGRGAARPAVGAAPLPSAAEPSGLQTLIMLSACSPVMHKARHGVGWSPGRLAAGKELGYGVLQGQGSHLKILRERSAGELWPLTNTYHSAGHGGGHL